MKKNQKIFLIATAIFVAIVLMYALKTENTNYSNTKEIISKERNPLSRVLYK
jgi:hypothetical protein